MVSTDFESALYHAYPNESDIEKYAYVIEFQIPNKKIERWDGYPYLWKGHKRKDDSIWFALMQKIPSDFIKKVHKVDYDTWQKQKQKGY